MKSMLCAALLAVGVASVLPAGAAKEAARDGGGRERATRAEDKKVFRYSFRIAETGFDPAQISDVYSRTVTPHIFEALYQYDPLARPAKVRPLTADGMPQHSADYRTGR
jgi:ABC-type oligopeptide transport system substrate-binding subunit